tara:strand:+ start:195 stop:602 length:408 start_codon:yes stop_codon:yes gene_type:complete
MGHYAKVKDGIVTDVIVAKYDYIQTLEDKDEWIKTSYNTVGGKHLAPNQGGILSDDQTKALRMNYAAVGYNYDREADAFYCESPYKSWILDKATYQWRPPVAPPEGKVACWDEDTTSWVEVTKEADLSNPPSDGD